MSNLSEKIAALKQATSELKESGSLDEGNTTTNAKWNKHGAHEISKSVDNHQQSGATALLKLKHDVDLHDAASHKADLGKGVPALKYFDREENRTNIKVPKGSTVVHDECGEMWAHHPTKGFIHGHVHDAFDRDDHESVPRNDSMKIQHESLDESRLIRAGGFTHKHEVQDGKHVITVTDSKGKVIHVSEHDDESDANDALSNQVKNSKKYRMEESTETEQLDELTKKTLGSYIQKASASLGDRAIEYGTKKAAQDEVDRFTNRLGVKTGPAGDYKSRDAISKAIGASTPEVEAAREKVITRHRGIAKAAGKLTKESTKENMNESKDKQHTTIDGLQHGLESHERADHKAYTEKKFPGVKLTFNRADELSLSGPKHQVHRAVVHHYGGDKAAAKSMHPELNESMEKIDLGNLFEGQEISEEFKEKIVTVFESAVAARVAQETELMENELAARALTESEELKEGLVEKVDGYLDFMVEQWIKNNQVALERGIKAEIFESFVSKMHDVFVEHNINLPDEEFDLVESSLEKTAELESRLDEAVAENVKLNQIIKGHAKDLMIEGFAKGMTDIDAEKFALLAEEIAFEDAESFAKKLEVISENYVTKEVKEEKLLEENVTLDASTTIVESQEKHEKVDPAMAAYLTMLNK